MRTRTASAKSADSASRLEQREGSGDFNPRSPVTGNCKVSDMGFHKGFVWWGNTPLTMQVSDSNVLIWEER